MPNQNGPESEAQNKPASPSRRPLVVGLGASAGGLEALERFFQNVPADSGNAYVVLTHLATDRSSLLPEILGRSSQAPVRQAAEGALVEPDNVYVLPPNSALTIQGGALRLQPLPPRPTRQNVIDVFFESLAADQDGYAVGVVLSGTGSDGTLGLGTVKAAAGMTMCQAPAEAGFGDMPRSAINAGVVDHVLPVEGMPEQLQRHAEQIRRLEQAGDPGVGNGEDRLRRVCAALWQATGHDFFQYKRNMVLRRLQRRLQANQLDNTEAYIQLIRRDRNEALRLRNELLIGVTSFFRDPEAFAALETEAIPSIFSRRTADQPIRVWVAACSTGEEAYSLAILLAERQRKTGSAPPVQIFATDINEGALEVARRGRYPSDIAERMNPEFLDRYFHKGEEEYQVSREIRDMCVFSAHDLLRDPPFARLDLISCRNVLIYLDPEAQRKAATLFHYALQPGGFLFLGRSESLSEPGDFFAAASGAYQLFRRLEGPSAGLFGVPAYPGGPGHLPLAAAANPPLEASQNRRLGELFRRTLLEEHSPAALLINDGGGILEVSGQTASYLQLAQGPFENNLFRMVSDSVSTQMRQLLQQAARDKRPASVEMDIPLARDKAQRTRLTARPIPHAAGSPLFMVVFQPVAQSAPDGSPESGAEPDSAAGMRARSLEVELQRTKETLQTMLEESRSSNEELLSMNEELQSANEELQASKEELQSVNEELQTVNSELSSKIEDLNRIRDDLENLLRSTNIATLFLDKELRIKWFTPATQNIFPMVASDIGRPISDIASPFKGGAWMEDLRATSDDLAPRERQLRLSQSGAWFMMRVLPYWTRAKTIEGSVVTFVDVNELQAARLNSIQLADIVKSANEAIISCQLDGIVVSCNAGAQAICGYSPEEMIGQSFWRLTPLDLQRERQEALNKAFVAQDALPPFDTMLMRKDGALIQVSMSLSPLRDTENIVTGFAAIMADITERKRLEEERARLGQRLEDESRQKDAFLVTLGHELRNPLAIITSATRLLEAKGLADNLIYGEDLDALKRQSGRLSRLVDDLLDLARISRGAIELRLTPLDIRNTAQEVAEDFRPICDSLGLRLELDLAPQAVWVMGDGDRLTQALANLISNSSKFTPAGGVITLSVREVDAQTVEVMVKDTGVGADAELLARLFEPFGSATQASSHPSAGFGVGLKLSKELIEMQGGGIQATSAGRGQGFSVALRLPILGRDERPALASAEQAPVGGSEVAESEARTILLIDDEPDAALIIGKLLALWGHEVRTASDGRSALAIAREFAPEVVISDISLAGDMDGHEVARSLTGDSALTRPALLIALTGLSGPSAERKIKDSGFDIIMIKPPDLERLRRVISQLFDDD